VRKTHLSIMYIYNCGGWSREVYSKCAYSCGVVNSYDGITYHSSNYIPYTTQKIPPLPISIQTPKG